MVVKINIPKRLLPKLKIFLLEENNKWRLVKMMTRKSKLTLKDVLDIDKKIKNSLSKSKDNSNL
jgi:hypothetical protein